MNTTIAKAKKRTAKAVDRMTPLRPFEGSGFLQVVRRNGKIIDPRRQHILNDREVVVLRRWIQNYQPGKTPLGTVEAILVRRCGIRPADLPALTWPQIIALLEHDIGGRLQLADRTALERRIITEIGHDCKTRKDLRHSYAGNFSDALTSLRNDGILTNRGSGYRVAKSFLYLLDEAETKGIN